MKWASDIKADFSSLQKKDFKILDFLFWFILGIIFPADAGNLSLLNTGAQ